MGAGNHIKNIIFIAAIVVFIGGAVGLYFLLTNIGGQDNNTSQTVSGMSSSGSIQMLDGKSAADFTVTDKDGKKVRLADYTGKPVIINFWASWCGACQSEMYDFQDVWEEYGSKVQFMMVNVTDGTSETKEKASEYITEHKLKFPVFYDTEGEASEAYSVYGLPCTYFIDRDGNLVGRVVGAVTSSVIEEGIEMIS